ncbi:hypothetical protein ABZ319_07715 [Nocardia sp. NPDC005978]|uniref:hypothetical protein n=1 Tax=Nocardia sp. NPDC005978 TaxID=3156725 RepID=UPI0033A724C4
MSKFVPLLSAGVWPLAMMAALIVAVMLVAVIALFRAKQDDVPKVFESFATGFGFHRRSCTHDGGPASAGGAVAGEDTSADDGAQADSSGEGV